MGLLNRTAKAGNETKITMESLEAHPDNPRKINESALVGLEASLEEFGDISGIVWNKRNGFLVAGHQRIEALKEKYGDGLEVVVEEPTKEIAILIEGTAHDFPVRVVDWDDAKHAAAMISANNQFIQGTFDLEGLNDLFGEIPEHLFEPLHIDLLVEQFGMAPETPDHCSTEEGEGEEEDTSQYTRGWQLLMTNAQFEWTSQAIDHLMEDSEYETSTQIFLNSLATHAKAKGFGATLPKGPE